MIDKLRNNVTIIINKIESLLGENVIKKLNNISTYDYEKKKEKIILMIFIS